MFWKKASWWEGKSQTARSESLIMFSKKQNIFMLAKTKSTAPETIRTTGSLQSFIFIGIQQFIATWIFNYRTANLYFSIIKKLGLLFREIWWLWVIDTQTPVSCMSLNFAPGYMQGSGLPALAMGVSIGCQMHGAIKTRYCKHDKLNYKTCFLQASSQIIYPALLKEVNPRVSAPIIWLQITNWQEIHDSEELVSKVKV